RDHRLIQLRRTESAATGRDPQLPRRGDKQHASRRSQREREPPGDLAGDATRLTVAVQRPDARAHRFERAPPEARRRGGNRVRRAPSETRGEEAAAACPAPAATSAGGEKTRYMKANDTT